MIIRSYVKSDVDEITKLALELHDNYVFNLNNFSSCFVCMENNHIIGFVTYFILYEKAEIIDICVKTEYRKKKIGTKLIEKVIDECYKNCCENITLEVNINNQVALNFYNCFDFKIVARRKNYYNNGTDDAYVMEKKLR